MGDTLPSKHLFQKQTLGIPKIFLFKILQTLKLKKPNFHWLEQLSGNNLCKNYSCKVVSYQPNLTMIKDIPNFDTLLDCSSDMILLMVPYIPYKLTEVRSEAATGGVL